MIKHSVMEPPSSSIISAQDLNLGYTQPILKELNLCVQPGEFIAVLGPNGAGKSTLLKTLSGALLPLKGTLKVLNHSPHQDCIGIGYMPQQLLKPELQHLTARTLLSAAIQAHQWGLPHLSAKQKEEIAVALTQIEGNDFADTPFQHCSGGQQRRIMLAQALLGQPKLLLLDEPLANLDFRHQEKFIELLVRLNRTYHTTILMTTHDVNLLTQAISRVLYMANGQAEIGSFQEIVNSKKLSALYQTPMEVIHYQHRYFVVHAETGQVENVCCEHV